jgi:hypothetical protein
MGVAPMFVTDARRSIALRNLAGSFIGAIRRKTAAHHR